MLTCYLPGAMFASGQHMRAHIVLILRRVKRVEGPARHIAGCIGRTARPTEIHGAFVLFASFDHEFVGLRAFGSEGAGQLVGYQGNALVLRTLVTRGAALAVNVLDDLLCDDVVSALVDHCGFRVTCEMGNGALLRCHLEDAMTDFLIT